LYNAYNTLISTFSNASEVDCFLGGLVAAGIPPQMVWDPSNTAEQVLPRVKYWLDTFRRFGFVNESGVQLLQASTFLVNLQGGTAAGKHVGLYVGRDNASVHQQLPILVDNTTLVVFCSWHVGAIQLAVGTENDREIALFGASAALVHMSGGFWRLEDASVFETIVSVDGTTTTNLIFARCSGQKSHSVRLKVGETARYSKEFYGNSNGADVSAKDTSGVPALKTSDEATVPRTRRDLELKIDDGSPRRNRSNVLLIVVDNYRPAMGAYGDKEAVTPRMDALAKDSTLFSRAFCQEAWCSPSRNSFLSGRSPDATQAWNFRDS